MFLDNGEVIHFVNPKVRSLSLLHCYRILEQFSRAKWPDLLFWGCVVMLSIHRSKLQWEQTHMSSAETQKQRVSNRQYTCSVCVPVYIIQVLRLKHRQSACISSPQNVGQLIVPLVGLRFVHQQAVLVSSISFTNDVHTLTHPWLLCGHSSAASVQCATELQDLLPGIMNELGPENKAALQHLAGQSRLHHCSVCRQTHTYRAACT
jgi:hypothetical protein